MKDEQRKRRVGPTTHGDGNDGTENRDSDADLIDNTTEEHPWRTKRADPTPTRSAAAGRDTPMKRRSTDSKVYRSFDD